MSIFELGLVKTYIDVRDKRVLFEMMVSDLFDNDVITDKTGFLDALLARESSLSTGIGNGVAIPHGRHETVKELKAVVYVLTDGIEYDALDGEPVNLVFMLAIPLSASSEYMKMLSLISKILQDSDNRDFFFTSNNAQEIYNFLRGIN